MQDADECIKLAPTFTKGYSRKGHLQFFMKEHTKAMATYELGLQQDPGNQELKDGLQRCMEAISKVCFCCAAAVRHSGTRERQMSPCSRSTTAIRSSRAAASATLWSASLAW